MRVLCIGLMCSSFLFSHFIKFAGIQFDPLIEGSTFIPDELRYGSIEEAEFKGLIQFKGPISLHQREFLISKGIKIEEYYQDYTYLVIFPNKEVFKTLSSEKPLGIRWVGIYHPYFKIHPEVYTIEYKTPKFKNDTLKPFVINLFSDSDNEKVARVLEEKFKAEIIKKGDHPHPLINRIYAKFSPKYLTQIAKIPDVKCITPMLEYFLYNNANRWVHQTNISVDTLIWEKGINGKGQILGEMDSGVDVNHCFFDGTVNGQQKIVGYNPYGDNQDGCTDGHGTHVAGTAVGGDDNVGTQGDYKGMAYMARLYVQDVQTTSSWNCNVGALDAIPSPLYDGFLDAYNAGARVHTNSWGGGNNSYTDDPHDADLFMWDYPDFLILFAAGNSSSAGQSNASNMGDQATAKNIITVGALARAPNQEVKAYYSSEGPPPDNRWKPDLMACGGDDRFNGYTYSADNGTTCGIQGSPFEGTSMATPVVAGSALLVRQYLIDSFGIQNPSAALIKAILIAGAEPVTGQGEPDPGPDYNWPSYDVGWGRVNLSNSLYFNDPDEDRALIAIEGPGLYTNQVVTDSFTIDTTGPTRDLTPLRIVLVWTDYPAAVNSNGGIVNDLDDSLYFKNSGTVYWGNNIDRVAKESQPGGNPDNINNVEVIHFSQSTVGNLIAAGDTQFTVSIIARNVPQGPQPYALVISGPVRRGWTLGVTENEFVAIWSHQGVLLKARLPEGTQSLSIYRKGQAESEYAIIYSVKDLNSQSGIFEYVDNTVSQGVYKYRIIGETNTRSFNLGPVTVFVGEKMGFKWIKPKNDIIRRKVNLVFSIPASGEVKVDLIDVSGKTRNILEKFLEGGIYSYMWDFHNVKPGTYFLMIRYRDKRKVKKVQILP